MYFMIISLVITPLAGATPTSSVQSASTQSLFITTGIFGAVGEIPISEEIFAVSEKTELLQSSTPGSCCANPLIIDKNNEGYYCSNIGGTSLPEQLCCPATDPGYSSTNPYVPKNQQDCLTNFYDDSNVCSQSYLMGSKCDTGCCFNAGSAPLGPEEACGASTQDACYYTDVPPNGVPQEDHNVWSYPGYGGDTPCWDSVERVAVDNCELPGYQVCSDFQTSGDCKAQSGCAWCGIGNGQCVSTCAYCGDRRNYDSDTQECTSAQQQTQCTDGADNDDDQLIDSEEACCYPGSVQNERDTCACPADPADKKIQYEPAQCTDVGGKILDPADYTTGGQFGCCTEPVRGIPACGNTRLYPGLADLLGQPRGWDVTNCQCGSTAVNLTNESGSRYCCNGVVGTTACGATATLFGYVKDSQDNPVAGATLSFSANTFTFSKSATSGADGSYSVDGLLVEGASSVYTATVTKFGYRTTSDTNLIIPSGSFTQHNFTIDPIGGSGECTQGNWPNIQLRARLQQCQEGIFLDWQYPCDDLLANPGYIITRSATNQLVSEEPAMFFISPQANSFVDPTAQYDVDSYNYTITALIDGAENNSDSEVIRSSDQDCIEKFCENGRNPFCSGDARATFVCDTNNHKTQAEGCGAAKCIEDSNLRGYCQGDGTQCKHVGIAGAFGKTTNVLGLYYWDYQAQCLNNYDFSCYYDVTKTPTDECKSCITQPTNVSSCYGYQSQFACEGDSQYEGDNCRVPKSTQGISCEWYETIENFGELGRGWCYEPEYNGTDKCNLCGADQPLFKDVACTPQACDVLGACIANADRTECEQCNIPGPDKDLFDPLSICEQFGDEYSCINEHEFDIPGDDMSAESFVYSGDACTLGVCKWDASISKCFKDGDDNAVPDCNIFTESGIKAACEKDTRAPQTSIITQRLVMNASNTTFNFSIDDFGWGDYPGVSRAFDFYYCISPANDTCVPQQLPQQVEDTFSLTIYPSDIPNYEGPAVLRFFSEDGFFNVEPINTVELYVDTTPPQAILEYAIDDTDGCALVVNVSAPETTYCSDLLIQKNEGQLQNTRISTEPLEVRFTNLTDGLYTYQVNCTENIAQDVSNVQTIYLRDINRNQPNVLVDCNHKIENLLPAPNTVMNYDDFADALSLDLGMDIETQDPNRAEPPYICAYTFDGPFYASGIYEQSRNVTRDTKYFYGYNVTLTIANNPLIISSLNQSSDIPIPLTSACYPNGAVLNQPIDQETAQFVLDSQPPATTLTVGTGRLAASFDPEAYYRADINISLSCEGTDHFNDGGNDCNATQYCISTSDYCTPSSAAIGPIPFQQRRTLCYASSDDAGNMEVRDNGLAKCALVRIVEQSPRVIIDKPVASAIFGPAERLILVNGTLTYDPLTLVDTVQLLWHNGTAFESRPIDILPGRSGWNATITLHEGNNTILALATDAAGNEGFAQRNVYVDTFGPDISNLTINGSSSNIRINSSLSYKIEVKYNDTKFTTLEGNEPYNVTVDLIKTSTDAVIYHNELNNTQIQHANFTFTAPSRTTQYRLVATVYDRYGNSNTRIIEDILGNDTTGPEFVNITIRTLDPGSGLLHNETLGEYTVGLGTYLLEFDATEDLINPPEVAGYFLNNGQNITLPFYLMDVTLPFNNVDTTLVGHYAYYFNTIDDANFYSIESNVVNGSIVGYDADNNSGRDVFSFKVDTLGPRAVSITSPQNSSSIYVIPATFIGNTYNRTAGQNVVLVKGGNIIAESVSASAPTLLGRFPLNMNTQIQNIINMSGTTLHVLSKNIPLHLGGINIVPGNYLSFNNSSNMNYRIIAVDDLGAYVYKITVDRTITEPKPATIYVFNKALAKGAFMFTGIDLDLGWNVFTVYGEDELGNPGDEIAFRVNYDNQIPIFYEETRTPAPESRINPQGILEIRVIADGTNSPVSSANLSYNGYTCTALEMFAFPAQQEYGQYAYGFGCKVFSPAEGDYDVIASVVDSVGLTNSTSWTFTIDRNVPRLTEVQPTGKISDTTPTIVLDFNDSDIDIQITSAAITGSGYSADITDQMNAGRQSGERFEYELQAGQLLTQEGLYRLDYSAVKHVPTTSPEYVNTSYFTLDLTPPVISEILPGTWFATNKSMALVKLRVNESVTCAWSADSGTNLDNPLFYFTYNVATNYYEANISLPGDNTYHFNISCRDDAGNVNAPTAITIVRDTVKPSPELDPITPNPTNGPITVTGRCEVGSTVYLYMSNQKLANVPPYNITSTPTNRTITFTNQDSLLTVNQSFTSVDPGATITFENRYGVPVTVVADQFSYTLGNGQTAQYVTQAGETITYTVALYNASQSQEKSFSVGTSVSDRFSIGYRIAGQNGNRNFTVECIDIAGNSNFSRVRTVYFNSSYQPGPEACIIIDTIGNCDCGDGMCAFGELCTEDCIITEPILSYSLSQTPLADHYYAPDETRNYYYVANYNASVEAHASVYVEVYQRSDYARLAYENDLAILDLFGNPFTQILTQANKTLIIDGRGYGVTYVSTGDTDAYVWVSGNHYVAVFLPYQPSDYNDRNVVLKNYLQKYPTP